MTPSFHWFTGPAVTQMAAYFHDYARPVAEVQVVGEGRDMVLRFLDADGNELGTVNDSHRCPPDCPPDGGG